MSTYTMLRAAAPVAFAVCLFAGLWILLHAGFSPSNALLSGIGFYFVGKAFFVGPMLLAAAERFSPPPGAARP